MREFISQIYFLVNKAWSNELALDAYNWANWWFLPAVAPVATLTFWSVLELDRTLLSSLSRPVLGLLSAAFLGDGYKTRLSSDRFYILVSLALLSVIYGREKFSISVELLSFWVLLSSGMPPRVYNGILVASLFSGDSSVLSVTFGLKMGSMKLKKIKE